MRGIFLIPALAIFSAPAFAGLFDDEEARRLATEAKQQAETRFEQQTDSLLDLSNQLQRQADEIAHLRGQVESLQYELEQSKKRQQDLYLDLDTRLRRFEGGEVAIPESPAAPTQNSGNIAPAPVKSTGNETAQYDAALADFKAERYKKAAQGFQSFVNSFPNSALSDKAHYWLGTSFYAQGQCTKAIAAHQVVIERFAESDAAPDSWLSIALCQQELGNVGSAKRSLNQLIKKYPQSQAAQTAKERLKALQNE